MAKSRPLMRVTRQSKALSKRRAFPYAIVLTIFLLISAFLLILLALGIFSTPISNPSTFSSSEEEEVENHEPVRPNHRRSNAESLSTFSEKEEENHQHVRPRPGRSTAEASSDGLGERGPQWTEVMSWEPRAFVYHNFLSKEECNYLIELAKPHMIKSTVVDNETGKSKDSRVRTSSGTFIQRGRDKVVRAIEKRIADYTFIPADHGEGLQILHYEVGQKYEPHFDYFLDEFNTKNGGQRMATFLMYLSHVDEGGETIFPDAKVNSSELHWHDELSECGKRGLGVKARAGDALLFWSMKPDTSLDPLSLHAGCPVIRGNKWSSTKWMHVNEYKP